MLPRLQLLELEDQSWFHTTIRDLSTDYIHFLETWFALHQHPRPDLRDRACQIRQRPVTPNNQPLAAITMPIDGVVEFVDTAGVISPKAFYRTSTD